MAASEGAEAIIYAYFALAGYGIARKKGIPGMLGLLQPMNRTTRFPLQPSPLFGTWNPIYNWTTFVVAQQLFGQTFKKHMNDWNRKLGLPPLPFAGFYSMADRKNIPGALRLQPNARAQAARLEGEHARHRVLVSGCHLRLGAARRPTAFPGGWRAACVCGLREHDHQDPGATTRVVVEALQRAGKRGIILSGWGAMHGAELPDDIYCIEFDPHDWLFPQMQAVVHHGGSGSTGAGLKSGVPSFAVPFFADQYFWGDRLARLGVGPKPVPRNRLTVERLAGAIKQATSDPRIKQRAAVAGKRARSEGGVERAVEAFEREVAGFRKRRQKY